MARKKKSADLTAKQLDVIKRGKEAGLTKAQVSVYTDPLFSPEQMEEIRLGFLEGLTQAQVRVFADPLVDVDEMRRIRKIYRLEAGIKKDMDELDHKVKDAEKRAKSFSKRGLFRQFSR